MWWELQKPEALHQLLVQSTSMCTLTPPIVNSVPAPSCICLLPHSSVLFLFRGGLLLTPWVSQQKQETAGISANGLSVMGKHNRQEVWVF